MFMADFYSLGLKFWVSVKGKKNKRNKFSYNKNKKVC